MALHALVDGLIGNWVLDPKSFPLARDARHMVDLFLNGLKAPARAGSMTARRATEKRAAKRGRAAARKA